VRPYEILVAIDSRPTDEEVAALLSTLEGNLKALGADVVRVENWGKRRLAYEIRKQREGTYAVIEAAAEPAMIREFERQLRLNDGVLRFLSTRVPAHRHAPPAEAAPEGGEEEVAEEVG
jgi:small subunit ribosomal protein S6